MDAYRSDLADIHDAGCGHFARSAGELLLKLLRQARQPDGLVVELGCGSGILAEILSAAGYDVLGIDISDAMIGLARQRVPKAEFRMGSFVSATLPPCVAVASIGEVFNYLFDKSNTIRALAGVLRRILAALEPGGLFLFDVAGPGRLPLPGSQTVYREGEGWAVGVTAEEAGRCLTRRITSFRKVGELYRRDFEEHRLRLYKPAEVMRVLRAARFRVRRLDGYGKLRFAKGHAGFLARKRCCAATVTHLPKSR